MKPVVYALLQLKSICLYINMSVTLQVTMDDFININETVIPQQTKRRHHTIHRHL